MVEDIKMESSSSENKESEPPKSAKSTGSKEDKDSNPKGTSLSPPPSSELIEEHIDDIVYEYECPSCGADVSEDMNKCPECGTEFEFDSKEVEEEQEEVSEPDVGLGDVKESKKVEYQCRVCGASVTLDMTKCPICEVDLEGFIKSS